ncbi:hypothetical protein DFH06DRAFT_344180 [Mycena polygramma]|nr:hypothetical protein DFH06DRAFT_344180 [Mycena polygramma]
MCLEAAPTLSLRLTSVEGTSHEPVLPSRVPVIQNLYLLGSPDAVNVLLSGQLESQRANIRKLWWFPAGKDGERLISGVASTIEHIRIAGVPAQKKLGEIDKLIVESAVCPRTHWRVDLAESLTLATYAAALQLRMPRIHAEGKLHIEQCSLLRCWDYSSWAKIT